MGQITQLIQSDLAGSSGTDAVYPITSTTAVIQPGTNKTVEELINAISKQNDVRSIRETTIVNSGRTLRFVYTDGEITDVDLPETVKAISLQKNGDTNIMTITNTNGNTQIFNIEDGKEYNVIATSDNVHIVREEDTESTPKSVTFKISVDTVAGEKGDKGDTGDAGTDGQDGKSAYQVAVDNGFVGTETEWLLSLKGQDGQNGTNGTNGVDGQDGQDGITPSIDPTTKHWMIGNTDTGVVAEGKDGKDGESGTSADYEAYDMMVRNETEFLDAVARSHGWKNTFWNNDATHLITDTTSDPKTGVTDPTTKPCLVRIHIASNINSLQNRVIDLTHCEVFGHDFVLKITDKLHIVGRSAKFESVKFEHASSTPNYYFYIEGQRDVTTFTHSKFRFTDCQFNNVDTIHPFITFIRGSVEGRNTYTVYIKGFETHDSTQNKFVITEDTTSGQRDGNHNLVITNRYTSYNITVNMSSSTTMESRMLYDSSIIAGTVTGVTAKNIFSTT